MVGVRDDLLSVMDGDDRIFVMKTTNYAAWKNVHCTNDWLIKNLAEGQSS